MPTRKIRVDEDQATMKEAMENGRGSNKGDKAIVLEKIPSDDAETTGSLKQLDATEDDILEARELAASMSLETVHGMMKEVLADHENDPNFNHATLEVIKTFLSNQDVLLNPEKHEHLVERIKLEAALIATNSPYAEVRANVDNHDKADMPVSTIRAWTLGCLFSVLLSFVNQLFSVRQPSIKFETNVAQLLSYPLGKCWERWMPRYDMPIPFTGRSVSLNPGPFNKKEHMLIAIMANTSKSLPYTNFMIWTQVLPQGFNQQYARSAGYMFLNAFATNFIGYGLAGVMRKILVKPAYCIWPTVFSTIALNAALHPGAGDETKTVRGPMRTTWSMSRYRFFLYTFFAMLVYFWFPNYLFQALSYFSWMTWIAPDNLTLNILTGMQNGLGLFNPFPTFDWNCMTYITDPLMLPSTTTFNAVGGMFLTGLLIPIAWFTNTWNTGYLPIITNRVHDHFGKLYNISNALDSRGMFDAKKYVKYSRPYLGAANALAYGWHFAIYTAIITHVLLYHRPQMIMGFKSIFKSLRCAFFRKKKKTDRSAGNAREEEKYPDVHNRLMSAYAEIPEWWFCLILAISMILGILGIVLWPTYTSPAVVLYGILLCLLFIVPIGVTVSMTGMEITLNVLAEFIGGVIVEGNALAMNFFKSYGYITCAHAVSFLQDLKIAHYVKIPPRVTFMGQMVATLISTSVCTGVFMFQMNIKDVCTESAPMRFFCPGPNTFMTASVLWGTIGPIKVFGKEGYYRWLLMGFPVGFLLVFIVWALQRRYPDSGFLRRINVVVAIAGSLQWAPYSFSYAWPALPVAWFSWIYVRSRYLNFWSRYNYVLSASLSAGVAISAIIMLFTVQWAGINVVWWGNTQPFKGCEGEPCRLYKLAEGERF
ncbi:hypothetical protein CDD80_7174 [Ophiocordyceps camponoti-rufipedis]|uniref:OPT family small oligopeptide transporter n=1 Tax=Ophiocordyceps camponoti-rufipedis TaxID=2004952 RepID=A0A2C5ZEJ4_9HYPO|nr:hypothetical protein CDD80_7174 [Ophiocordyceps camponoti-rufipedis]